ncbi:MAG: DUF3187 family protein [Nitrospirota bacterium]
MKDIRKIFLFIIFLIISSPSIILAFDGPFQVKNQYPIFIHADQPYLEKASMENSLSFSVSHSSTYTVQNSGNWTINLDMEITEINLRYKRIINDIVEFGMDVPVVVFSGGFMDGFLESYHDTFGFPDYGRSSRPHNEFLYEVRRDGRLVVEGETGVGLGDIRISLKTPLISSNGFNLSVKGDVELPSGRAKKGYGNGNVDMGISVLADKSISDAVMTYWNFGAVFPGDVKGHETVNLENFIYGGAGLEAALNENFSLLAQVQGQSSIYPETDLLAVDREAYLLVVGGRFYEGNGSLEFSLSEDISESGAPDFIITLTYKIKL